MVYQLESVNQWEVTTEVEDRRNISRHVSLGSPIRTDIICAEIGYVTVTIAGWISI